MPGYDDSTAARLAPIRQGLLSDVDTEWTAALREVLQETLSRRLLWFDMAGEIAAVSDREGARAALADLVAYLVFVH